jgi:glycosyltransferase involved in cell wall biosynthesis
MARCLPWKRPEMFLALAERFPGEKFVMVAPGCGDRAAAPVVARAKRMPNLTLIERVPFREVQDLFDGATLFVNTSEQEGFPNTFLHAGLGATPIVSLAVDPDGFIARHGCGIVCNGSPGQMERAVARLLADPAERQRLGCAAYEYVRRNHDLGAVAGELKAILLSLTRGSGTRRPTLQKSR